jgi:hypothetical protein
MAGAFLMLLRSDWSFNKKQQFLISMQDLKLYPFVAKTEFFVRDFFISVVNNKKIFNFLLKISSIKIIRTFVFFPLK